MLTIGCTGDAAAASLTIDLIASVSALFRIRPGSSPYHTSCLCPATLAAGLPRSALLEAVADIALIEGGVMRGCVMLGVRRGREAVRGDRGLNAYAMQVDELRVLFISHKYIVVQCRIAP